MNYFILEINLTEFEKNSESSFNHIKSSFLLNYYRHTLQNWKKIENSIYHI